MKLSKISYALFAGFLVAFFVTGALADTQEDAPGYLGVRLMPVPELLMVHLGLDEGAGQLIINIVIDSPADKAGLVRYDVITAIDGNEVRDYGKFVETVQSAGAGTNVTLAFISKGKKQNVKVRLEEAPTGQPDWKYEKTPLGISRYDKPGQQEREFFWSDPFEEDDEFEYTLPDRLRRFFRKEFRFRKGPNDGGITIIPNEQTDRVDELEKRLNELESRQEEILEKLEKLQKKQ
jgi:membrane-associated protease RseP (regulator of RpoE activity)